MMFVTQRYRFAASHRLHLDELTEKENEQLYGKCNNPFGHGHDYVLEITAQGLPDPRSGLILLRQEMDRLAREQVLNTFEYRNINLDVPQFAASVPTTENIALVIAGLLQEHWKTYISSSAQLSRIHIQETDRNGFELFVPFGQQKPEMNKKYDLAGIHG